MNKLNIIFCVLVDSIGIESYRFTQKNMKNLFLFLISLCLLLTVNAQIYSTNLGTTTTGTPPSPFNPTPLVINPNVTTAGWTGGNSFQTGETGGSYAINGGGGGSGVYSITLNVGSGNTLDISSISFKMRTPNQGANGYAVTVGGIAFSGGTFSSNDVFQSLISAGIANGLSGSVTIRITTSNGSGNRVNSLDDVAIMGSVVLPVKLQSFTATNKATSVDLKWNVALESGIINYEVERSADGVKFDKLNSINAKNLASYNLNDNTPAKGSNFYRLRINEINGVFSYSDIVKVEIAGTALNINSLYPNPVTSFVKLNIGNDAASKASISVLDISGKVILTDNVSLIAGITEKTINTSNLKSGIYILKLNGSGQSVSVKFIKL